jgi:plastocyanin
MDEPNPTLTLRKGEPVKLVLRNDDPGTLLHCFVIPGLNVKTTESLAGGESEILLFTPRERGGYVYACLLHPAMAGKLVVE